MAKAFYLFIYLAVFFFFAFFAFFFLKDFFLVFCVCMCGDKYKHMSDVSPHRPERAFDPLELRTGTGSWEQPHVGASI